MAIDLNRIAALKAKLASAQKAVAEKVTAHVEGHLETAAVAAYEKGLGVVEAVASAFTSVDSATHAAAAPAATTTEAPKKTS